MYFKRMIWILALTCLCPSCGDDGPTEIDAAPDLADAMQTVPDAGSSGGTCRSSAECSDPNESCVGPNDVVCGIPPQEECASDQDCGGDSVCHAIGDSCSADGVGSRCGSPCTLAEECGQGFRCGDQGACEAILCDDPEFDCRASETCDPASVDPTAPVHQRAHGCARITCQDDGPCPGDTVCVNGTCQDGPGTCSPPVP